MQPERVELFWAAGDLFKKERAVPAALQAQITAAKEAGDVTKVRELTRKRDNLVELFATRFKQETDRLRAIHAVPNPTDACRRELQLGSRSGASLSLKELYLLHKCFVILNDSSKSETDQAKWYFADVQFTAVVFATGMSPLEFADEPFVKELQLDWADSQLGFNAAFALGQ